MSSNKQIFRKLISYLEKDMSRKWKPFDLPVSDIIGTDKNGDYSAMVKFKDDSDENNYIDMIEFMEYNNLKVEDLD